MVKASVVIPTYNRKGLLKRCIDSLLNQSYKDFEIIVVDDGSTDGTRDILKCMKVKYIRQKRKGPAAARNTGIKSAKAEIIAFTDDDCEIDRDWVKNVVLSFNDKYDAVKGNTKSRLNKKDSLAWHLEKHIYVSKGSSATNNIAYKRKALEVVNYFDEYFPVPAYEDVDLLTRFKMKGLKIKYCKDAVVYHNHENNINDLKKKHFISGVGLSYFFKKYLLINPSVSINALYQNLLELIYLPKFLLTIFTNDKYYFSKEYFKIIKCTNVIKGFLVGLMTKPRQMSK